MAGALYSVPPRAPERRGMWGRPGARGGGGGSFRPAEARVLGDNMLVEGRRTIGRLVGLALGLGAALMAVTAAPAPAADPSVIVVEDWSRPPAGKAGSPP